MREIARSLPCARRVCCTATWCSRSANCRRDLASGSSMRLASPRTSSTDRKAPACSICAPACRSTPIGFGGAHENQRRPGTENVAAIAGMAAAAAWALEGSRARAGARGASARSALGERSRAASPSARQNGDRGASAGEHAERQLSRRELGDDADGARPGRRLRIERLGVHGRLGRWRRTSCSPWAHQQDVASSAIRFSLGKQTTAAEIDAAASAIARTLERLTPDSRSIRAADYAVV